MRGSLNRIEPSSKMEVPLARVTSGPSQYSRLPFERLDLLVLKEVE